MVCREQLASFKGAQKLNTRALFAGVALYTAHLHSHELTHLHRSRRISSPKDHWRDSLVLMTKVVNDCTLYTFLLPCLKQPTPYE